jgi:hypothetical protein
VTTDPTAPLGRLVSAESAVQELMSVNAPTAARLAALAGRLEGAGGPPSQEDQAQRERLQDRLGQAARLTAVLTLLAIAAMAVARYMA